MKRILFIVFLSILIYSCLYSQDFSLNLLLDKNEYLKGEPIRGIAILKNNALTVKIYPIVGSNELQILLLDSTKTLLKTVMAQQRIDYDKRVDFQQGETMGAYLEISRSISDDPEHGISLFETRSIKTGKYFLQLKYIYKDPSTSSKQKKEFNSDLKEINVVEPKSEIDKTVYKMLTDISTQHIIDLPLKERAGYAQMLLDLIKKYPDSGYFPSAYYNLFYVFDKSDYYKFDDIIENMFSKYPESNMGLVAFTWYEAHRKEIFKTKEFHKTVNDNTKKSLMSFDKYYKKLFKEIDDSLK